MILVGNLKRKIRHKWVTRQKLLQHSLFCGTCLVYDMTAEREFLKASSSLDYIHVEQ